jgi:large subunit ribosomal protein L14
MIQKSSSLNVVDNSGAKSAYCIQIIKGNQKRYARLGDAMIVVVKKIRKLYKMTSKVIKSEMYSAVLIQVKKNKYLINGLNYYFYFNAIILYTKLFKLIGSKIFVAMLNNLRFTKISKAIFIANGILL